MQRSEIGWTGKSCNPIRLLKEDGTLGGHWCKKISPGCTHCYAEAINNNPYFSFASMLPYTGEPPPLELDRKLLLSWTRARKSELVFVGSMTDVFGDWVPQEWHFEIFRAAAKSKLVFQFLTKRPLFMFQSVHNWQKADQIDSIPPNFWWGATVETANYKFRLDYLREIPGPVRFVSFEPLLNDLGALDLSGIEWAILGGESKSTFHPNPRPFHIEWCDRAIKQCQVADVRVYFKQLGHNVYAGGNKLKVKGKGVDLDQIPPHLQLREWPIDLAALKR